MNEFVDIWETQHHSHDIKDQQIRPEGKCPVDDGHLSQETEGPSERDPHGPGASSPTPSPEAQPRESTEMGRGTLAPRPAAPDLTASHDGSAALDSPLTHGPTVEIDDTGREKRSQKKPRHLTDYICYTAWSKNPSSSAQPPQKVCSGKPYPIANYVTCDRFSNNAHRGYLDAITKVVEPRYFHEAIKDSRWR